MSAIKFDFLEILCVLATRKYLVYGDMYKGGWVIEFLNIESTTANIYPAQNHYIIPLEKIKV